MYSENSYKNYIFWLKVRQIFLLILFSIIGCVIGRFIGQYLVEVLLMNVMSLYISVTVSTLLFFGIACAMTAGTAKEVQEAYWRIALLRKLTVISKKLDNIPELEKEDIKEVKKEIKEIVDVSNEELKEEGDIVQDLLED